MQRPRRSPKIAAIGPRVHLAAALLLASCYSPDFRECAVECGAGQVCPAGTTCGSDSFCHADPGVVCEPVQRCQGPADCADPPASRCIDGTTLTTSAPAGQCIDRQCVYESSEQACADRCEGGACVCTVDCSELGKNCGTATASCGEVECGGCSAPLICGGGGEVNVCGSCEISPFMPGFPAQNCGNANPYYCSNLDACVADEVNCNTLTECPDGTFLCPCGFVVDCERMECVPGDGSEPV